MSHVSSPEGIPPQTDPRAPGIPFPGSVASHVAGRPLAATPPTRRRRGREFFSRCFHGVFGTVVRKGTSSGFTIEDMLVQCGSIWSDGISMSMDASRFLSIHIQIIVDDLSDQNEQWRGFKQWNQWKPWCLIISNPRDTNGYPATL